MGILTDLSNDLRKAAEVGGRSVVLVDARNRFPASGIAFSAELVLTADHVVTRDADLKIWEPDGESLAATLVGRDPSSDLALLRVTKKKLTPAKMAQPQPGIGQLVLALGRPTEAGIEASWGILTSIGGPARTGRGGLLAKYIRSETTPYPGFSGGPLVDTDGALLGLNTSGLTPGGSLTIPTEVAWPIADALSRDGRVKRGYLGVRTQPADAGDEHGQGLLVLWLEEGGPAAKGGVLVGDIISGIDGKKVSDPDDIFVALSGDKVGKTIELEIIRGGKAQKVRMAAGERR